MRALSRSNVPTFFLQGVVVLLGLGVLAFLLIEPHFEGRNAHATLFEVYFKDPFLAYVYLASIPGFAALHQVFGALGLIRAGKTFTPETVNALRTAKRCALAVLGFVALAELYILLSVSDDRAGGVVLGGVIGLGVAVAAAAAATFERIARAGAK